MANETILVVDDEETEREGWKRALRLAGYHVHAASNAGDALTLCDEQAFDVVILDFLMPQMDGVELLRRIRQKQPVVRSVLVSGKIQPSVDEKEITQQAREAVEADAYLHKPVSNDRLKETIHSLMAAGTPQTWKEVADVVTREKGRGPRKGRDLARALRKLTKRGKRHR